MLIAYALSLLASFSVLAIEFVQSTLTAWFQGGDGFTVLVLSLSIFGFYAFPFVIGVLALRSRLKTGTASGHYNVALGVAAIFVFLQGASSVLRPLPAMTGGDWLQIGLYGLLGLLIAAPYLWGVSWRVLARRKPR